MDNAIDFGPFDGFVDDLGPVKDGSAVEALLRRLEAFLDALPDDAWMKDTEGRYVVVNDRFATTLDMDRSEIIGRTDAELFPDAATAAAFRETDEIAQQTGERVVREHWGAGPQDTHRLYETIKAPVRDENGAVLGTVGIARDVTDRHERENRLRTAEGRYRRLATTSPDGIFVTDPEGTVIEVNQALCRILGRSEDEILGSPFTEFVAPRSLADVLERFGDRDERDFSTLECWIRRPDGEERLIEARSNLIREDGQITGTHGLARDVTAARRQKEAERRMVDVLEATPDIVVIRDADGKLLYTNQTGREWGADEEQLDDWDQVLAEAHPEWAAERVTEDGIPTALAEGSWTGETAILSADGREVPISQVIIAGRDGQGNLLHVSTIMRDISAIKAREKALRRRDAILEAVSQAGTEFLRAPDWEHGTEKGLAYLAEATQVSRLSVLRLDRQSEGHYTATLVGEWTAEGIPAMLGDPMLQDIPADAAGMSRWVERFLEDKAVYGPVSELPPREHELLKAQDIQSVAAVPIRVDAELWGMLVFDDCESPRRWVPTEIEALRAAAGALGAAIQRRRTEKELADREEELRQSQKMEAVGRLAGGVAHDFNNMLTAIQGFATLARRQIGGDEQGDHYLAEILRAADRSAALTRQLLAFSRKQVLRPQVVNLNGIIGDMQAMLRRLLGETIELEASLQDDLGSVKVDPAQIEQVIMNLSVNARDAMPDGGTLRITTGNRRVNGHAISVHDGQLDSGRYVELAVEDTGTGLDPEVRERIFEPFFTTKGTGEGTGLGLSTVYGIVSQSGGGIAVESEPGEGTTFRIYFPRCGPSEETPDQDTRAAGGEPLTGARGETVLVVEDESSVRRLIQGVLEQAGYTVLTAATGVEAMALIRQHQASIHLLLTDVVMPEMGGPELADILQEQHPELRVCFMSGYTEDEVFRRGVQVQNETFLEKPFTPGQLQERVAAILSERVEAEEPT